MTDLLYRKPMPDMYHNSKKYRFHSVSWVSLLVLPSITSWYHTCELNFSLNMLITQTGNQIPKNCSKVFSLIFEEQLKLIPKSFIWKSQFLNGSRYLLQRLYNLWLLLTANSQCVILRPGMSWIWMTPSANNNWNSTPWAHVINRCP